VIILTRASKLNNIIKTTDEPIAFILGKYATTGLGVSRCFGRLKIPVLWLDSNPKQIGFHSKYCTGIVCPHQKNNEKDYVDFLLTLGERLSHKGVFFPTGDIEVLVILKHRSKLEQYYHIPMADLKITEILLNKQKFYQTLEKQGISYPKTYFPNDISEIESISNEVRYPCIVKPVHSEYFRHVFNTKFFRIESRQELIQGYRKAISKNQEVMIQEIIPGDAKHMCGFNAYYNKNSEPNGVFMYRRIREWPPVSGNGVLIENVVIPELEQIISSFVKNINYYGIVDAEFKKDPRNGTFNLLEINPRCWMQISFPLKCGVNLPYIAYLDALDKDVEKYTPNQEQAKWLFIFQDIFSSWNSIVNGNLSLRKWIRSFKGKKEYAVFAWDDPAPFIIGFFRIFIGLSRY
jgi:predicted ATP-grasp superfamily ATP-dependent carboligase